MNSSLRTIEVEGIGPLSYTITEDGTRIWHFEACHLDTFEIEDRRFNGHTIESLLKREISTPKTAVADAIRRECQ